MAQPASASAVSLRLVEADLQALAQEARRASGLSQVKEACERAAGLVVSHLYRYKVRAQGFADHILMSRYPNLDLATARSTLFSERLNHIQTELAKSQAQVKHGVGIDPTLLACVPPLRARCAEPPKWPT